MAGANLLIGALSASRLSSEIVQQWFWEQGRTWRGTAWGFGTAGSDYLVFLMDAAVAVLWLASGWGVKNRRGWAVLLSVIAASAALVDSLITSQLAGPRWIVQAMDSGENEAAMVGAVGGRLLLYGAQVIYSPVALGLSFRDYTKWEAPEIYYYFTRDFLWFAGVVTAFSTGLIQFSIKGKLTGFL